MVGLQRTFLDETLWFSLRSLRSLRLMPFFQWTREILWKLRVTEQNIFDSMVVINDE